MNKSDFQNIFARIQQGERSTALQKALDGILIQVQSSQEHLNAFTVAMSESEMAPTLKQLWDNMPLQRWDFTSTESIANITPIFGYLWLMVAAEQTRQDGKYTRVVPNISTSDKGCGTIDTLASGGLTFTSDPSIIKRKSLELGGVICQQDEALTPINKVLMSRCKATNLMTNVYLTYASILSKQIAIRCTHSIIDVKLGRDTKILSAWMNELEGCHVNDYLTAFKNNNPENEQSIVIDDEKSLESFAKVLKKLGVTAHLFIDKHEQIGWVKQDWNNNDCKLYPLKEVYWLLTNANIPQCRAIGRQLILLHVDRLISDETELLMQTSENEYKKLYRQVLPRICDCQDANSQKTWEMLQKQWEKLKSQLPKFNKFSAKEYLMKDSLELETRHLLLSPFGQAISDLETIAFGLYPYQQQVAHQKVKIKMMNVQFLDEFFSWLCGNDLFDPEVGIWLHKLPGETVDQVVDGLAHGKRELKICQKWQEPVISIFYRPSRTSKSKVIAKARQFLCQLEVIPYQI